MTSFFGGRALAIATMHQKEKVLAPSLEAALKVTCIVPSQLDTDQFGTFTGEIPRLNTILATARAKCEKVNEQQGYDLVLASEGSFGPHPSIPFLPSDHEFLLLKDFKNGIEVTGATLSTATNYAQQEVGAWHELLEFAKRVHFPSHAIILRSSVASARVFKGITSEQQLRECFQCMRQSGRVSAETDMRAQFNPSRMKVIGEAAKDLTKHALSVCPVCQTPGFGVQCAQPGLPCSGCGNPTRSVLKEVWECQRCHHHSEKWFPNDREYENPMYCDYCNP